VDGTNKGKEREWKLDADADARRANYLNLQRGVLSDTRGREHGLDFRDTVDFTVQLGDVQFPTRSERG